MAKKNHFRTRKRASSLAEELRIIGGPFAAYMDARGYAHGTRMTYQSLLRRIAISLAKRGRSLAELRRNNALELSSAASDWRERIALSRWIGFREGDPPVPPRPKWQRWADDFGHHLSVHKGVAAETRRYCLRHAREFLTQVFGGGAARWHRVRPEDVWQYAETCAQRLKPNTANLALAALRLFLRFVLLREDRAATLLKAVPCVASYGQSSRPEVLTGQQCCRFLRAFARREPVGRRDYALARCMLDLGLRSGETVQLRLADVDWTRRCLTVSGLKRGRSRELPLPAKLFAALRAYVDRGRPVSGSDRLFLRHRFREGEPLDSHLVRAAMGRAYRRAGLAASWAGTHRLRHTFATRLLAKGASFKQLADLLGHRTQESTVIYTHADLRSLRQVAQPWPC